MGFENSTKCVIFCLKMIKILGSNLKVKFVYKMGGFGAEYLVKILCWVDL